MPLTDPRNPTQTERSQIHVQGAAAHDGEGQLPQVETAARQVTLLDARHATSLPLAPDTPIRIETDKRIRLTPYELNLDFWRQLWRVIERSDVLIQVVDARNPLLFRNADLENYVKEVDENKVNIVLINKADFLTEDQRYVIDILWRID